ncbi:hypothetical protein [Fibrobacter sp.]
MLLERCRNKAAFVLGLACMGLFWDACSDASPYLDNPEQSGEDVIAESSSSVGYYVPQAGKESSTGEPVDTAAIIADDLGECSDFRSGEITRTSFCGGTCYAICDSSMWRYATLDERDVYGFPKDTVEGAILEGRLMSYDKVYVFENGSWRPLTFIEKTIGYCDSSIYAKIDSVRGSYYHCVPVEEGKSKWAEIPPVQVDYILLPSSAAEEDLVFGTRSNRYFLFRKGAWRMATIEEVVGCCYEEREAELVRFTNGYFVCKDDSWEPATRDDVLGTCSSAREGDSARVGHIEFECRSNSWAPVNLHSHTVDSSFYWDVSADDGGRVVLDSSTSSSGYFYEFTDVIYEGISSLRYPAHVRRDKNRIYMDQVVDEYQEIFVTADFGGGLPRPFAGIGFNLWNGMVWSDSSEGADIRKWKGLCIVYYSDAPLTVAIAPEGGVILEGGNFFKARMPSVSQPLLIDIPFESFMEDNDLGYPVSRESVLSSAASILVYLEGVAGHTNSFAIQAIGSLGQCDQRK